MRRRRVRITPTNNVRPWCKGTPGAHAAHPGHLTPIDSRVRLIHRVAFTQMEGGGLARSTHRSLAPQSQSFQRARSCRKNRCGPRNSYGLGGDWCNRSGCIRRWSVFKKRTAQSGAGLRTGEIWPVAVLCKRCCPRNGIRLATDLGRNPTSLQSLRNSNSNEQEVVGFLVLDETRSRTWPPSRRRSNYSPRFRYPGACETLATLDLARYASPPRLLGLRPEAMRFTNVHPASVISAGWLRLPRPSAGLREHPLHSSRSSRVLRGRSHQSPLCPDRW